MGLNFGQIFSPRPEILANYDYVDIAEGTGIVAFYGLSVSIDNNFANNEHTLSKSPIATSGGVGGNVYTTIINGNSETFEVTFNKPQIINGNCFFVLPMVTNASIATIDIYHYDGITETSIATQLVLPTNTANKEDRTGKMPLTKTKFKKGDTLRFKVSASGANILLFHTTAGSQADFAESGGTMKVYVPFDLNL